ncbi:hypothetical protein LXA47_23600 [Massilia sp. P8910]|uniref:hypothetical protein n=1 Tax=Massilia antarctica TaxID=2765360 RepID=UPI001E64CB4B|nr:hypothetical protein [Massilia antarctica]MCE3606565.1 hypothetical protein [Massilia antarctica]
MGFADEVKKFTGTAKAKLVDAQKQVEMNAKQRLLEVLGDDVGLIKSIKLDMDVGKFYEIDAPVEVVERLRAADVVKE